MHVGLSCKRSARLSAMSREEACVLSVAISLLLFVRYANKRAQCFGVHLCNAVLTATLVGCIVVHYRRGGGGSFFYTNGGVRNQFIVIMAKRYRCYKPPNLKEMGGSSWNTRVF